MTRGMVAIYCAEMVQGSFSGWVIDVQYLEGGRVDSRMPLSSAVLYTGFQPNTRELIKQLTKRLITASVIIK